jgi:hypothetical protein
VGSFLIQGFQGEAPESQAAATGLTIRELILLNLKATIETIKAIEQSRPGLANTIITSAVAAGSYVGTVTRKYRVDVVLAGASGVAKYTVTDVTYGTDSGPVAQVITSGVAFVVGALGVTLTLTWTGALALGDTWDLYAGPYQTSIGLVLREDDDQPTQQPEGDWCVIGKVAEDANESPLGKWTKHMLVPLGVFLRKSDDSTISAFLGDLEQALMVDYTRGGYAVDTDLVSNTSYARDTAKAFGGFDLMINIHYRHKRDDPKVN